VYRGLRKSGSEADAAAGVSSVGGAGSAGSTAMLTSSGRPVTSWTAALMRGR
jgi:hypothetical protein